MSFVLKIRVAAMTDFAALNELIRTSAWVLLKDYYTAEQIEAALGTAWGVDTQLIRDGTFYVVEDEGRIVGCGGWSGRKTLFGADAGPGREPGLLDPASDPARIRAFFVAPDFARRGIGRMLLAHCEAQARIAGFQSAELVATLGGEVLYSRHGYSVLERREYPLNEGLTICFVRMRKDRLG
jgi:N-acetylglutamate synthase-like GNAT family acetyltransferase